MLGPTSSVFLDHVSRDRGDVTVVRVELRWTPRGLHISSAAVIDYSYFPVCIALRAVLFGRMFAKFDDLGEMYVTVMSTVPGCDVTTVQQHYKG